MTINPTLENFTLQQIIRFAHSPNQEVSQFGTRAAKLVRLASKLSMTDREVVELRNLNTNLRHELETNKQLVANLRTTSFEA